VAAFWDFALQNGFKVDFYSGNNARASNKIARKIANFSEKLKILPDKYP
jgi:hypothetical protein